MRASRLEQHPLTYVRHRLGWSMERLARELHLAAARHGMILNPDRDRVYKWESGRVHAPDGDYQMLLAELLGVDQELVRSMGWPWWLPAYDIPYGFEPDGTRAVLREVLVALQHPERPDRRVFLAVGAAALASVGQQWAAVEPGRLLGALHGRRVDGTLLAWLETRTDELRAMTNTNAPECTDLVHSLLRTSIQLIDNAVYDHATERRLHQVTASAAQCAGWLHFDQGEHAAAQTHWIAALHAAHSSADRDLGAGILSDLAYLATWLNLPTTAVTLAGDRAGPDPLPRRPRPAPPAPRRSARHHWRRTRHCSRPDRRRERPRPRAARYDTGLGVLDVSRCYAVCQPVPARGCLKASLLPGWLAVVGASGDDGFDAYGFVGYAVSQISWAGSVQDDRSVRHPAGKEFRDQVGEAEWVDRVAGAPQFVQRPPA